MCCRLGGFRQLRGSENGRICRNSNSVLSELAGIGCCRGLTILQKSGRKKIWRLSSGICRGEASSRRRKKSCRSGVNCKTNISRNGSIMPLFNTAETKSSTGQQSTLLSRNMEQTKIPFYQKELIQIISIVSSKLSLFTQWGSISYFKKWEAVKSKNLCGKFMWFCWNTVQMVILRP